MKNFWTNLSIKSKIGFSVLIGVMQAGALCFFTFKGMFYHEQLDHIANKEKLIGTQVENLIEYTSTQQRILQSVVDSLPNYETKIKAPVIKACEIAQKNSEGFDINVVVPNSGLWTYSKSLEKINNDKQKQLEEGKINEYNFVDEKTNTMRYIQKLRLSEFCLTNGKQTAVPDNQTASRQVTGYLEVSASLDQAQEKALNDSLIIGGVTCAAASIVVVIAFWLAGQIDKRLKKLGEITREFKAGNYDACITITGQDEICELADEFNNMAGKIKQVNESLLEEKKTVEKKIVGIKI